MQHEYAERQEHDRTNAVVQLKGRPRLHIAAFFMCERLGGSDKGKNSDVTQASPYKQRYAWV